MTCECLPILNNLSQSLINIVWFLIFLSFYKRTFVRPILVKYFGFVTFDKLYLFMFLFMQVHHNCNQGHFFVNFPLCKIVPSCHLLRSSEAALRGKTQIVWTGSCVINAPIVCTNCLPSDAFEYNVKYTPQILLSKMI